MSGGKPEFIDNQGDNTLDHAIHAHVAWLREHRKPPITLDVATGFFNVGGFRLIADQLESLDHVRILIGAEVSPPVPRARRAPGEPRGQRYERAQVDRALRAHEHGMRSEVDLLGFSQDADRIVDRLVTFLRSGRAEVRRYAKGFMHGKAYIFGGEEGVIAGSSNLTFAGLTTNIELNLGQYQPHVVKQVHEWFERLWIDAEPYDLAALFASRFREYPPYWIYLRALYERYGEELHEEESAAGRIPLTTFQNDGLLRARRILDRFHGVLVADGVGLGKSFLAGEMIRETLQDRRQRVLLIAPATLRDGSWAAFQARQNLYFETVSYEELAMDHRLRADGKGTVILRAEPQEYSLVVVDEAHAMRNPHTDRAGALRRLLRGTPPKKLVLLTATPVNNALWDLYYLLGYFIGHDAAFADAGIPSLKKKFQSAMSEDPYDLKPDVLFDVLDAVTVRRTRNFVRKNYPHEKVRLGNGQEIEIKFPKPCVRRIDYDFDAVMPGFFAEIAEALLPPEGQSPKLTMARYVPSAYRKKGAPSTSQEALAGLLRSGILKRFESSVGAFALTCEKMVRSHNLFLDVLETGRVPTRELMAELANEDSDDIDLDDLVAELGAEVVEPAKEYRIDELRRDVTADRDLLGGFATRARAVHRKEDPKLAQLAEALAHVLAEAKSDALSDDHERDLRKVLVFTYFADTVDWIVGYLEELIGKDKRFAAYEGRFASVAGRESRGGVDRKSAVLSFVPRSTDAPRGTPDRFDVLVCTDVLAEGLNLQQCRHIINYDLPWNPMRLVQRHGRIDRIGSPYDEVFIACFFPTQKLDAMLELERRIRSKLAQAAASVGVEDAPIPGGSTGEVVFSDSDEEIRRLYDENAELLITAGEGDETRSGEEYRQELRRGLEAHANEIKALPYGAGSGLVRGPRRGHFFCIRVLDRVFYRFVPLDSDADLVRDTLRCLRTITCAPEMPRVLPDDLREGAYVAWNRARKDVFDEWMHATDPANLQPRIRPLFLEVGEHLRRYPPPELTQQGLEEIIESVVGPWPLRYERELRAVFVRGGDNEQLSTALVGKVRELGLQPYHPPKPLDEIDEDEVQLVCWMGVESGPGVASGRRSVL